MKEGLLYKIKHGSGFQLRIKGCLVRIGVMEYPWVLNPSECSIWKIICYAGYPGFIYKKNFQARFLWFASGISQKGYKIPEYNG